jgi:hypothetical protein
MNDTASMPMHSDPVLISLPLVGDDAELSAIGAIVHLLERTYFQPGMQQLEPIAKDRIARYLFDRYTLPQTRTE